MNHSKSISKKISQSATRIRVVLSYLTLAACGAGAFSLSITFGFSTLVLKVAAMVAVFCLMAILAKRLKRQDGSIKKHYTWADFGQDIGFVFKMVMIAMTLSLGMNGALVISAILLIEKTHLFPEKSVLGKLARKFPYLSILAQIAGGVFIFFGFNALSEFLQHMAVKLVTSVFGKSFLLRPEGVLSAVNLVNLLSFWLPLLGVIIAVAKLHGGSFKKLWFLNGQKNEPFLSWKRDKFKILIFMATALSALVGILMFPQTTIFYAFSKYSFYLLVSIFTLFSVQPLVEELFFRSGLLYYFKSEGVVSKDTTKTSIWSKLSTSALGGVFFAIVHQLVRGFTSLIPYLRLFMTGFSYTFITLTLGNISAATLYHSMHNICCNIAPGSFCVIGQRHVGSVNINPVVADSVRTVLTIKDEKRQKSGGDNQDITSVAVAAAA